MTIGELKKLLELFADDNDALVKYSHESGGWVEIKEVSFHNDVNTLLLHGDE
jgi:hypothetical protein